MNTDVPGSPESCRSTANALDRLARQLGDAERLTARGARTPGSRFDGRSADAYRAACASLADDASMLAVEVRRAADSLSSYADDLAAVQQVMERVRSSAANHGLLDGNHLTLPPAPLPAQQRAFDRLSAIAADALAHLEAARDRLSDAFPGQPFPVDYSDLFTPDEPAGPDGPGFPPPESSWPPDDRQRVLPQPDGRSGREWCPAEPADDGKGDAPIPRGPDGHLDTTPPPNGREPQQDGAGPDRHSEIGYSDSDSARLPGHLLRPVPRAVP